MSRKEQFNLEDEKISELKKLSDIRTERAYSILKNGKPKIINKQEFLVPASNPNYKFKVTHRDAWTCECPDFQKTCKDKGLYCKHIKAIQFFLKLRNKTEIDNILNENSRKECIYCKSKNIIKRRIRKSNKGNLQRYYCKDCKKRFILNPIKYIKINAKNICLVMDLYFKGLSLRDIQDTLDQFHKIEISHESIRRYIRNFTKLMNNYVKEQTNGKLKLGGKWQTDEQTIQVGKEKLWNWNTIDTKTKYLVANNITKSRYYDDTVKIIEKAKEECGRPEELRTDGLRGYPGAIREVFELNKLKFPYTVHVKSKGFRDNINTNIVERYHNEWREFDKIRRGFGNMETAQDWNEGYRLFHNVIRKNMALNGLTPLQNAEIDLDLGRNRWLGLLLKSLNVTNKENHNKSP